MRRIVSVFCLSTMFALFGCSKDAPTTIPENDSANVPAETQGLLNKYAVPLEIPTADNELVEQSVMPAAPSYENYDVYAVTLLWGSLTNTAPGGGPLVDWSGSATINGVSTIDVTHTIHFETGQDSLIATNNPPMAVWVSQTAGDFDGVNLLIYLDKDIVYITAPMLTITMPAITKTFDFGALENLDAFYPVSNTSALAIHSRRIYSSSCETGAITGEWVRADVGGQNGTFQTTWWDTNGSPFGQFAGNFWTEDSDLRIFEGWVSLGLTAQVVYHVYGTWHYDDPRMCPLCGSSHGVFVGFYTDMSNKLIGFVKGQFGDYALDPAQNNLPLNGYWRAFCNNTDYSFQRWVK
ncbi:MAG: hypothetical protein WBP29_10505 [Candidatus Zixiibacteriota bacterium]